MHNRIASNGSVAQLVEQRTENPCVGGSIPSRATITRHTQSAEVAKWQTHHLEGVAPRGMRVQVPPSAQLKIILNLAIFQLQGFFMFFLGSISHMRDYQMRCSRRIVDYNKTQRKKVCIALHTLFCKCSFDTCYDKRFSPPPLPMICRCERPVERVPCPVSKPLMTSCKLCICIFKSLIAAAIPSIAFAP